jgi:hypothetical protein
MQTQAATVVQQSFALPRFVLRDKGRQGSVSTMIAT